MAFLAVPRNHYLSVGAPRQNRRERIQTQSVLLYVGTVAWVATRGKNRPNLGGKDNRTKCSLRWRLCRRTLIRHRGKRALNNPGADKGDLFGGNRITA